MTRKNFEFSVFQFPNCHTVQPKLTLRISDILLSSAQLSKPPSITETRLLLCLSPCCLGLHIFEISTFKSHSHFSTTPKGLFWSKSSQQQPLSHARHHHSPCLHELQLCSAAHRASSAASPAHAALAHSLRSQATAAFARSGPPCGIQGSCKITESKYSIAASGALQSS